MIRKLFHLKSAHLTVIGIGIVTIIILPLLNLTGVLSDYYLNLFGKYLALAIFAVGMDLIWGYTGILSLGQAIFFGIGAYAMGMHLMLTSSGQGVYGEAIPDFMIWNQVYELPFFWKPFYFFPLAVLLACAVPVIIAGLIGLLTFRRHVSGVYFAILTQAMAYATWLMINRNEMNLGGTNGLTDFKMLLGFSLHAPATQRVLYIITAVVLVLVLTGCLWLVRSKMGLALKATRDQEQRLQFLGYPIVSYKIFAFMLAAALAGIGGALYVPQVGIITPNQIGVMPSLEVVVWVAVGGRGTLFGALLGGIGVNALRSFLTTQVPDWWPIILGSLFVGVVLLFPGGLMGLPDQVRHWWKSLRRRLSSHESPPQPRAPSEHKPLESITATTQDKVS